MGMAANCYAETGRQCGELVEAISNLSCRWVRGKGKRTCFISKVGSISHGWGRLRMAN